MLKFCYVPAARYLRCLFQWHFWLFLLRPLTVITKQPRQVVRAINPSIFLRCLWAKHRFYCYDHYTSLSCDFSTGKQGKNLRNGNKKLLRQRMVLITKAESFIAQAALNARSAKPYFFAPKLTVPY